MSTLIDALKARIANPGTSPELRVATISQLRTLAANSDDRRSTGALSALRELGVEFDPEPAVSSETDFKLSEADELEQFRSWSLPEGRRYFQKLFPWPHSLTDQDERFIKIRAYFDKRTQAAQKAGDESLRKKLVVWRSSATLDAAL